VLLSKTLAQNRHRDQNKDKSQSLLACPPARSHARPLARRHEGGRHAGGGKGEAASQTARRPAAARGEDLAPSQVEGRGRKHGCRLPESSRDYRRRLKSVEVMRIKKESCSRTTTKKSENNRRAKPQRREKERKKRRKKEKSNKANKQAGRQASKQAIDSNETVAAEPKAGKGHVRSLRGLL